MHKKIAKFNTDPNNEAKTMYVTKLVFVQRSKFLTLSTSPGTIMITIDTPMALKSELRYNTVILLVLYSSLVRFNITPLSAVNKSLKKMTM